MARVRLMQPHLPQSHALNRCTRDARLLFRWLCTLADAAGRLTFRVVEVQELRFPTDTDVPMMIMTWLDELEHEDLIERYTVDERQYARIVKWRKLQKGLQNPTPSRLPGAHSEAGEIREIHEI